MPVKNRHNRTHHVSHHREKRTKKFLKVYAPYIPLITIVVSGFLLAINHNYAPAQAEVKGYATDVSDAGLLEETNKLRAKEGLPALKHNRFLDEAAQNKAIDMGSRNYWSHNTPDGKQPWAFIDSSVYGYKKAAENLAFGFDDSKATLSGWMNSPGHRANVMDKDLKDVGFGIVNIPNYQGKGPETLIVAMYADPAVLLSDNSPLSPQEESASLTAKDISYVQALTAGRAPWSGFVAGLIFGAIIMYLTVKHGNSLRRTLKRGENYIIHHPLLDLTLISLLALLAVLSQTAGTIH